MRADDSRSEMGEIKIHKKVMASIAALAATQIDGVKAIGGDVRSRIYALLGIKGLSSIRVEIDKNGEVKLNLPLVVKYGYNLPDIANKVQDSVHQALEKMTNLSIKDINVSVQEIEKE